MGTKQIKDIATKATGICEVYSAYTNGYFLPISNSEGNLGHFKQCFTIKAPYFSKSDSSYRDLQSTITMNELSLSALYVPRSHDDNLTMCIYTLYIDFDIVRADHGDLLFRLDRGNSTWHGTEMNGKTMAIFPIYRLMTGSSENKVEVVDLLSIKSGGRGLFHVNVEVESQRLSGHYKGYATWLTR